MLSLHKIEAELERFRVTGLPAYLVVRFTDVATIGICVRASSRCPSVDAGFPESSTVARKRSIVNYRSRADWYLLVRDKFRAPTQSAYNH